MGERIEGISGLKNKLINFENELLIVSSHDIFLPNIDVLFLFFCKTFTLRKTFWHILQKNELFPWLKKNEKS